jgi:hypothetical protein
MKNLYIFCAFVIIISSCENTIAPNSQETTLIIENKENVIDSINNLIDQWHLAAANSDFDDYFSFLDSNSIFIGTDETELWSKNEFMNFSKPYFDNGSAWDFKAINRNVVLNESNQIAWFDESLNTWMGNCRGSGVLELTRYGWKIKHYVLSLAIPNDHMIEISSLIKESKFKE